MCGIAGYFMPDRSRSAPAEAVVRRMGDAIAHRGPDSAGEWSDAQAGIALAHRRLAVVDLSWAGHQPMVSADGKLVLVFNGEIYNHLALREELGSAAGAWRGSSDTETLLAAFAHWGIADTLARCVGMYAFALWNRDSGELTLGRDRLGEKPLYYGWQERDGLRAFLFGSELSALKPHPAFEAVIDRQALALLMRYGYVPTPHAIYRGIRKLEAGSLLTVSAAAPEACVRSYWQACTVAERGVAAPIVGGTQQAVDRLEALLGQAVQAQTLADVPVGAFLSGGVDSSTIVALLAAQSATKVKTFTIGFDDPGYDEAGHARAVAAHLGTDHTEMYVTAAQALDVIPRLASIYAEPFADSSQIPTFLVSQLARAQVTVSLSGDGGDELFCGYNRYVLTDRVWSKLTRLPPALRRLVARCMLSRSAASWNRILGPLQALLPAGLRQADPGNKLHKAARVATARDVTELYQGLVSHADDPGALVQGAGQFAPAPMLPGALQTGMSDVEQMMLLDTLTYLPDDILVKLDRAAMAVALEGRVPFLDHRVVEFAWQLPQSLKLRDGVSKWILRQVLYRHVPQSLIERPKMGFGVPLDAWLRGPLRAWAEALLDGDRLRREGYFVADAVRAKWEEHLSGRRNWQGQLWCVLMFQAWLENEQANAGASAGGAHAALLAVGGAAT